MVFPDLVPLVFALGFIFSIIQFLNYSLDVEEESEPGKNLLIYTIICIIVGGYLFAIAYAAGLVIFGMV